MAFTHFKIVQLYKSFKYLLFPFSLIYALIIWMRNKLYDTRILKSAAFNFPIICVGNLATGGTGKTPMTEYLVTLLQPAFSTATLSRGYKRKTKGFAIAGTSTTAIDIGDEPMQIHQKFPGLTVAVGEERLVAIPQLLHDRPDTQVIILDDAFQHRSVTAGLNILLTEQQNLYTRDFTVPTGDLRDIRSSARRAHIIIVTKCIAGFSEHERQAVISELKPLAGQSVYFTEFFYGTPYHLFNHQPVSIHAEMECLLVCGIANPTPLMQHLTKHVAGYDMLKYADHHIFTTDNLQEIITHFEKLKAQDRIILTTEKDAVRLHKYERELSNYPVYVIPVKHRFLFGQAQQFADSIIATVNKLGNSANGSRPS